MYMNWSRLPRVKVDLTFTQADKLLGICFELLHSGRPNMLRLQKSDVQMLKKLDKELRKGLEC